MQKWIKIIALVVIIVIAGFVITATVRVGIKYCKAQQEAECRQQEHLNYLRGLSR